MKKIFKASEFEEKFIKVVDDVVAAREKAVVVKDGVPVAEIVPTDVPKRKRPKTLFGMDKNIVMHDDLIAPAWDGDFGDSK